MMKKLAIIGACGHGKVLADIAIRTGYEDIVFFDDNKTESEYGGWPIIGKTVDIAKHDEDVIVAIGNAKTRQWFLETLEREKKNIATLIHPNAVIADDVIIGIGSVVMAGAILQPGSAIGKGCIINTDSSLDHDSRVGNYVHVAVGAHLAGEIEVGARTWIGAGAIVSNNVSIHCDCMIGAGAVVIRDIKDSGTFVGVPAKQLVNDKGGAKSSLTNIYIYILYLLFLKYG